MVASVILLACWEHTSVFTLLPPAPFYPRFIACFNNKKKPWGLTQPSVESITPCICDLSRKYVTYKLGKYLTLRLNHINLFVYLFLLGIWWISWNTRKARGKTSRIGSKSPKVRKGNQTCRIFSLLPPPLSCSFWKEDDKTVRFYLQIWCCGRACVKMSLSKINRSLQNLVLR